MSDCETLKIKKKIIEIGKNQKTLVKLSLKYGVYYQNH